MFLHFKKTISLGDIKKILVYLNNACLGLTKYYLEINNLDMMKKYL